MRSVTGFRRFPALLLAVVCCTLSANDEEAVLNIYNWADYIAADTISNFEREFGIRVNYDLYDSTEVVEAKLLSVSTGYDVVFHGFRYSSRLIPIGVYRPLDRAQLSLIGNLDPWVLSMMQAYDPGNRFGIPYMWGTTGFAYNVDMVAARLPHAPVQSAAMLFDPEVVRHFADCGVTLLDEPTDVIPMVLLYLGLDPNSLDPADLARAESQLKAVRPYIRYFSSTRMTNDLPNKEVCVAMSWSGDYAVARERAADAGFEIDLAYTVPSEGSISHHCTEERVGAAWGRNTVWVAQSFPARYTTFWMRESFVWILQGGVRHAVQPGGPDICGAKSSAPAGATTSGAELAQPAVAG